MEKVRKVFQSLGTGLDWKVFVCLFGWWVRIGWNRLNY